jgi:hypothetical protein
MDYETWRAHWWQNILAILAWAEMRPPRPRWLKVKK